MWLWWPRILQFSHWVKDRWPHWTVIWTPSLIVVLDGINRFMEEFHSLSYISTIQTVLLHTDPVTPLLNSTQITKLNQIIVWSSVMWMWMTLQCITVTHGTALLKSTYHSDSQHDKNLLAAHIHFCFQPANSHIRYRMLYEYYKTHLHRADSNSRCFLCVRTEENLHRSLRLIEDELQHCVFRSIQKIH